MINNNTNILQQQIPQPTSKYCNTYKYFYNNDTDTVSTFDSTMLIQRENTKYTMIYIHIQI